jgi:dTDP-4-amino-4,6-dideoxygalactose transaminase
VTPLPVPFLDLARHDQRYRDAIDAAALRVLRSGWYILGAEGAAFETEFAAYCGAQHAVGVGSGTDAVFLALRACGVGPGDTVVTAPNTAIPTVAAIVATGARPDFVEIEPLTFTLDPGRLRADLASPQRPRALKAIVAVHLYGHMADLPALADLARSHHLPLIADAAQAHGARLLDHKAGTLADLTCFSFYPTKNLGAAGDAGIVVTNSETLAARVRSLRNYGETRRYHTVESGYNSRLDEIQAAILRAKLPLLDAWNARRRALAARYADLLAETPLLLPLERPGARHAFHLYVVRSPHRDALQTHLNAHGIGTCIHYPVPIHLQPAYQSLGYQPGDFPIAEQACREVLSLPLHPELLDAEQDAVAQAIVAFFKRPDAPTPHLTSG